MNPKMRYTLAITFRDGVTEYLTTHSERAAERAGGFAEALGLEVRIEEREEPPPPVSDDLTEEEKMRLRARARRAQVEERREEDAAAD